MTHPEIFDSLAICVVIPTYNNRGTIEQVIRSVRDYCHHIIVVCDGPTDCTDQVVRALGDAVTAICYSPNKGKGAALATGFEEARRQGFRYAVTLDSDGQHYAADLPLFAEQIAMHPDSLVMGCRRLMHDNMPQKNTFANRFSNFWFTVQTGLNLPDTQSGYRLYPLLKMQKMKPLTSRYEAELELLVRAAWRKIPIIPIDIQVYYPPAAERVSHFRPGRDFLRISLLNTVLCFVAIFYGWPRRLIMRNEE